MRDAFPGRSAARLRGGLQIRGPERVRVTVGPGSAEQREGALRRVRDTKPIASPLNKARRAFFDIGTHRLKLVGASDQLLLLDGLG